LQKKILVLLLLTGIIGIASAHASPIATITALKPPVWLQQDNGVTTLRRNSELKIGDNIATGDAGRVEIKLWADALLQLNSSSEIEIRAASASSSERQLRLYIHQGRGCINYRARPGVEKKFRVNIGNTMFATIHHHGDICVLRRSGLSSIKLRAGSVQITHSVDPNLIILSVTGTEFHIEDSGSYKLLYPGDELSTVEIEKPFILGTAVEKATPATPSEAEAAASSPDPVDTYEYTSGESWPAATPKNAVSADTYTVYLFASRDQGAAELLNRRIREAGHNTQVYESLSGSVLYFRVAAGGFASRQEAKEFSDFIVGKFGISESWIGKDP